ncbi:MAG: hypothetical protein ACRDN9_04765 [Streptosporangiaceae bacterium]
MTEDEGSAEPQEPTLGNDAGDFPEDTAEDSGVEDSGGDSATASPDGSRAEPVPTPGEEEGDMWPRINAVRAESDDEHVTRVSGTALAPPGKPDGEVDTRP